MPKPDDGLVPQTVTDHLLAAAIEELREIRKLLDVRSQELQVKEVPKRR